MDIGNALSESFAYTQEGLVGKWMKWILLIILQILPSLPFIAWVILFIGSSMMSGIPDMGMFFSGLAVAFIIALLLGAFYQGFLLRVLRAEKPLPEVTDFGVLFSDGIKYLIIQIIYMIPVVIVLGAVAGAAIMAAITRGITGPEDMAGLIVPALGGIFIAGILAIVLTLFAIVGVIRFARTGSMGEAFNFSAILATIGKIGWGSYIFALIVIAVVLMFVSVIIGIIPVLGPIIQLILGPFLSVFSVRYHLSAL